MKRIKAKFHSIVAGCPFTVLGLAVLISAAASTSYAAEANRDIDRAQQELLRAQDEIQGKMSTPKGKTRPTKSVDEVLGETQVESGTVTNVPVKTDAPVKKESKKKEKADKKTKAESATKASAATAAATVSTNKTSTAAPVEEEVVNGERVSSVKIIGDALLLDKTGMRKELEGEVIGRKFNEEKARKLAKKFEDNLHNVGYYFATFAAVWPIKDGVLEFAFDPGRYGKVRIHKRTEDGQGKPFKGKYFSEKQIRKRLGGLREGEAFNYAELYNAVYQINAHPDILADVDLKLKEDKEAKPVKRVVDMDFFVEEDFPLHAVLELSNNGTDVTDEWQAGITLQHLNVSGRDDIITLNVPFSLDFESIKSASVGYYLPHEWRNGGSFALYGGYSELNSESVIDEIGLEGDGLFVGVQGTYNFILAEDYTFNGGLGISHSIVNDNLVLQDQPELDREVSLTPLVLMANYIGMNPDRWEGMNLASLGLTVHSSSFPGASDDEDFEMQRENAEADYLVGRLRTSRVQPVFASEENPESVWTWYTKLDAQLASGPLIPSEQKGVGGYDTVRGYIEREYLGDDGANLTFELRTPYRRSSVFPKWFKKYDEKNPAFETLQGLVFLDAAYISLQDAIAGEDDSQALASVGLGFRVSLGTTLQFRADWGFPLEETEDSDMSGRGHLGLQLLF